MTDYTLKSWPHFFKAIKEGTKKHDLRKIGEGDYNFKVSDTLFLQEYDPFGNGYTGEEVEVKITYITSYETPCAYSSAALDRGFAILSIELVS